MTDDSRSAGIAPAQLIEHSKARTSEVKERVRKAMQLIESEIESNSGVYPYNGGAISQSEVCRRAGISKITLQKPLHKTTTKADVDKWVAHAKTAVSTGRRSIRRVVTARADFWKTEHEKLASAYALAELQWIHLKSRMMELEKENKLLRQKLAEEPNGKIILFPSRG